MPYICCQYKSGHLPHFQHPIRLQPPNVPSGDARRLGIGGELVDLAHDFAGFGGFGVGDVDGVAAAGGDVGEFAGQGHRGQVQAAFGQALLPVAEGGFDDEHADVELVHALPEGGVALGVAAEDPVRAAGGGARGEAAGGHGVDGGQDFDVLARPGADLQGLADDDVVEADEGGLEAGDAGEVGPDDVVEDVGAQGLDGGAQGVHAQRPGAAAGDGIEHERQGGDVVEVGVGEEDVVDARHFVEAEVAHAGAGIDEDVAVKKKGGRAAISRDSTRAPQNTHLHGNSLWLVYLVSKWVAPSQDGSLGAGSMEANRWAYSR